MRTIVQVDHRLGLSTDREELLQFLGNPVVSVLGSQAAETTGSIGQRDWGHPPRALTDVLAVGGDEAKRAFEAMMAMRKIDITAIEAARRG